VTFKDLLLPVQWQMIGGLGHDDLGQQTGTGSALFDRLRWLGGPSSPCRRKRISCRHPQDGQLRRNVLVALTGFFPDGPQILVSNAAVLFHFRQIMHDPLPLEMLRQRLPAARLDVSGG
jgi:hypothetical protein